MRLWGIKKTHFLLLLMLFCAFHVGYGQERALEKWLFFSEINPDVKKVTLPHTWNDTDAFDDTPGYFRGTGTYTTEIKVSDLTKKYFLHFNGANQHTKVWVNNTYVGEHQGGYTAFDIPVTHQIVEGINRIKVTVNNSHNESVPPLDADFTFYGGLYRTALLKAKQKIHFKLRNGAEAIKIDPILQTNGSGDLTINGELTNPENDSIRLEATLYYKKKKVAVRTKKTTTDFNMTISLPNPKVWSPDSPNLYSLELLLYHGQNEVDRFKNKIGFRRFSASTSGFVLNGKKIKLIGVNRHQDWEGLGNAVPVQTQLKDLAMIKEMGANFLRLAHYPQDRAIYRAADSLGLLLWSEIPVINKVPAYEHYSAYRKHALQMQKEHIAQNYNHPSLVFIGYMNEIFLRLAFDKTNQQTRTKIIENSVSLAKELEELTRYEAPHHTTVMAVHGNQIYNETGIADIPMVVGWNLYYGWYEGAVEDLGPFLDKEFEKYPNRPLLISEYGVGADQRIHNDKPKKFDFSEEYQFTFHPSYVKQVNDRPFVIGLSAWNFADFGSEFRGDAMPHINQKGLVNFDRTPKNSYYWYQSILKPKVPILKFFKEAATSIRVAPTKKLLIISNQSGKLKVNHVISEFTPEQGIASETIQLNEGENKIQLLNLKGEVKDEMIIIRKRPSLIFEKELALNFGTTSYFNGASNRLWIPVSEVPSLIITGAVVNEKSSTNIRDTDDDPLYQSAISEVTEIAIPARKGRYKVTLFIANLGKDAKQIYELSKSGNSVSSSQTRQVFVNGTVLEIPSLEKFYSIAVFTEVAVEKNIKITSSDNETFALSGMLVERLN